MLIFVCLSVYTLPVIIGAIILMETYRSEGFSFKYLS